MGSHKPQISGKRPVVMQNGMKFETQAATDPEKGICACACVCVCGGGGGGTRVKTMIMMLMMMVSRTVTGSAFIPFLNQVRICMF